MRELVARIEALLRRQELAAHATRPAALQEWTFGAWRVNSLARRLRGADDRSVELTASEYRLLEILVMHPGQTHSRAALLKSIYVVALDGRGSQHRQSRGTPAPQAGRGPARSRLIRTVRGGGYVLTAAVRVTRVAASPRAPKRRDGALMGRVQDKVAVVIGAAQPEGIGAGIARRLAEEGALVTIADVDAVNGPATAASLAAGDGSPFVPST